MNLSKDPFFKLIINDNSFIHQKVSCFYFSDYYYHELCYLLNNNKILISKLVGKIMTHTYFDFISKGLSKVYYTKLLLSRFNILIGQSIFKQIRTDRGL